MHEPAEQIDAAWLNDVGASTLAGRLGITFVEVSPERLVATMPVAGNTQLQGLLHGGASAALAETLGSIGAALHAGKGRFALGVDINATHHRAVRRGVVTGIATPVFRGESMATYEVVVRDEQDERVCTARITCAIHARRRARRAGSDRSDGSDG
jgi:uncharacterized protein (TIGR00369 family)